MHLISDVRDEFGVADLPVSIGLSGFGGWGQANDRRLGPRAGAESRGTAAAATRPAAGIMRAQYNVSTYARPRLLSERS